MTTIFFIVDGRRLEAQATLLASTLHHHNAGKFNLVAYVPAAGALDPATRSLFDRCNLQVCPLPPALKPWRKPYPHGNKILAAAERRPGDWGLFLDTDMICTGPLDLSALQQPNRIAVVPEGVPSWGREGDRWQRAYAHFGMDLPPDRVTLTRRKRISFLPYFNAGFILFPEADLGPGRRFGELWLDTALDFDWNAQIASKRPWLDQITLPLTLKRFGIGYVVAPVDVNFSISDRAPDLQTPATLIHYHRMGYLSAWPQHAAALRVLAEVAGPTLHARLETAFGDLYHAEPIAAG